MLAELALLFFRQAVAEVNHEASYERAMAGRS